MRRFALGFAAAIAFATTAAHAQATSISGKVVDLATYMTHDHNMDAMKMSHESSTQSDSMRPESMKPNAMQGEATACPSSLGLVTPSGKIYLLATQLGSATMQSLCKQVGKTASVAGTVYTQGGMSALLVK